MEIRHFGVGGRLSECKRLLAERLGDKGGRLFLLPIPSTRDNRYINGTSVVIEDIAMMLDSDSAVVGYNIPEKITDRAKSVGARVFDAGLDEDFLLENAELTARGTVGFILTHYKRDLSEMRVGVVGYGRIGMRLVRWLLLFGATLTVYTRREALALELCEAGISAKTVEEGDFSKLDILINTTPKRQIEESDLDPDTDIIDLASGISFDPSERLVRLASVPESYYPITAGRLYGEAAIRSLWGEKI